MSGSIIVVQRYSRAMIRTMPSTLFVFGDNLARIGYGGQAKEARGEPNSIGIPTKKHPSRFFSDTEEDFNLSKEPIVKAFVILASHLRSGKDIVWPADGVGTGLADLPNQAPQIHDAIERCKKGLFSMADKVIVNLYL